MKRLLYQTLRSKPGNLFFSPYSIYTALAMTYAGAGGETHGGDYKIFGQSTAGRSGKERNSCPFRQPEGVVEEAPEDYKDVREVVDVVHNSGLARKVARMRPLGVVKG